MPGRNGSGPLGQGALTGRRLGPCSGTDIARYGAGFGLGLGLGYACRRGFGRGMGLNYRAGQFQARPSKEQLMEQREILENRLDDIDKELDNISDS